MSDPSLTPLDVLSFGEALVDFFPERPGTPLVDVDVFHRHLGGAPANVAVGLGRLGVKVGLMTLVGPDDFGRFVRRRLTEEGVDVSPIGTHRTAKTGVTFVAVGEAGQRSFLFFRHPSADQMIAEVDVDPAQIARARIVHVGSSTLSREPARAATLKAIACAREAGCLLSTDPNFRPHLWEEPALATQLMRELCAQADVVKVSDDELPPIASTTGVELGAARLRELGAKLVVVTLGARGCYYAAAAGSGYLHGESVAVVDTTGAGDAFVAGLLARLVAALGPREAGRTVDQLDEATLREACSAANRFGAAATTRLGATAGLPPRAA